jgi:hypothetical protein
MANFYQLYTKILEDQEIRTEGDPASLSGNDGDTPLLDSGTESKAMEVVRIGKNLNKDFWGNFEKLCNNTDGLADLLDVDAQKVSSWSLRIHEVLKKVENNDANKKNRMISTGNSGPLAVGDSDGGTATTPGDTAPTP